MPRTALQQHATHREVLPVHGAARQIETLGCKGTLESLYIIQPLSPLCNCALYIRIRCSNVFPLLPCRFFAVLDAAVGSLSQRAESQGRSKTVKAALFHWQRNNETPSRAAWCFQARFIAAVRHHTPRAVWSALPFINRREAIFKARGFKVGCVRQLQGTSNMLWCLRRCACSPPPNCRFVICHQGWLGASNCSS